MWRTTQAPEHPPRKIINVTAVHENERRLRAAGAARGGLSTLTRSLAWSWRALRNRPGRITPVHVVLSCTASASRDCRHPRWFRE